MRGSSFQDQIEEEVQKLLALKEKYKEMTGEDLTGGGGKKGKVRRGRVAERGGGGRRGKIRRGARRAR